MQDEGGVQGADSQVQAAARHSDGEADAAQSGPPLELPGSLQLMVLASICVQHSLYLHSIAAFMHEAGSLSGPNQRTRMQRLDNRSGAAARRCTALWTSAVSTILSSMLVVARKVTCSTRLARVSCGAGQ